MTAPEVAVHGTVEPGFEGVLAAFEENFATHGDVGASVAVTIGGRMVVDLWGGTASFDGPDDDEAGVPGVEGDWQAPADELPQTLSARAFVQTTRILREATSNIIKHSGATHCSVKAGLADGDFQLVVQDNGAGISDEDDGRLDRGHGMSSMKHRAKQLQGQCLVESGPGYGTVIRLTVPLDRAIEASAS